MVQAVGFCLPRGLAHILAVPEQTVEVELVGVLAIRSEARVTGMRRAHSVDENGLRFLRNVVTAQ